MEQNTKNICRDEDVKMIIYCNDPQTWGAEREPCEIEIGDKFMVVAQENPSTGYTWLVLDKELEYHGLSGVVCQSNTRYEKAKDVQSGMVGVPGTRFIEM